MAGRNAETGSEDFTPAANGVPEEPGTAGPETVGGMLRQAREAAGLSLDMVAERTKIRPGILTAIETDDHYALPALTYTLGFVKAYARTIGLDPQAAADRYRFESRKGEPVPTIVDLEPLEEKRLPSRGLVTGVSALVILALGVLAAWGLGWLSPAPPPDPVPVAAPAEPAPRTIVEAPAPEPANAPVRLTATDEVWLRVTDETARETLFMGTLTKGQVLDLPADRPWQLFTGRAGALEVRVGGRVLPPLGGPAERLRGVLLTPDALTERAKAAS